MESFLFTISAFLLMFNFLGNTSSILVNQVKANTDYLFPNNFVLANNKFIPYKIQGVGDFNKETISAKSFLVVDEKTGRFLEKNNIQEIYPIASLTKLMSVLVWLDVDGDLNKEVEINSQDYREGGIAYFIAGEHILTKDLLNVGLVASSNSAIASLVRSSGLTEAEFVGLMNKKARSWGMNNTIFVEPTGLNSKNVSTARELYILAREAFNNDIIKSISVKKNYIFSPLNKLASRSVKSTNWLLGGDNSYNIIGGKTGYIEESGYNFILKSYSKERDANLYVIILNSNNINSRFTEADTLIQWIFNNYMWTL